MACIVKDGFQCLQIAVYIAEYADFHVPKEGLALAPCMGDGKGRAEKLAYYNP